MIQISETCSCSNDAPSPPGASWSSESSGSVLAIYYVNIMCINRMTNTHTTHTNISNIPVFTNIYICDTCYPWCFIGIILREADLTTSRWSKVGENIHKTLCCEARETKMLLYLVVWDNIRFQVWIHRSHLSICLVSVVPSTRERAEHELNKCKCLQINPVRVWTDFNQ